MLLTLNCVMRTFYSFVALVRSWCHWFSLSLLRQLLLQNFHSLSVNQKLFDILNWFQTETFPSFISFNKSSNQPALWFPNEVIKKEQMRAHQTDSYEWKWMTRNKEQRVLFCHQECERLNFHWMHWMTKNRSCNCLNSRCVHKKIVVCFNKRVVCLDSRENEYKKNGKRNQEKKRKERKSENENW